MPKIMRIQQKIIALNLGGALSTLTRFSQSGMPLDPLYQQYRRIRRNDVGYRKIRQGIG
jgi:hypothetical protein